MAGSFEAPGESGVCGGPPGPFRTHHDNGVGFEEGVDYFGRVANEVDIDIGFYRSVRGQSTKAAAGEGHRDLGMVERERIGHHFEHQQPDLRREVVSESGGGFERG